MYNIPNRNSVGESNISTIDEEIKAIRENIDSFANSLNDLSNSGELSSTRKECLELENIIGADSLDLETMISEVEMSEKLVANLKEADGELLKVQSTRTEAIKSESKLLGEFIEESQISMKEMITSTFVAAQDIENRTKV